MPLEVACPDVPRSKRRDLETVSRPEDCCDVRPFSMKRLLRRLREPVAIGDRFSILRRHWDETARSLS
jgi:hypothetical protein